MSLKSFSLVALLALAALVGCSKGPKKPADLPKLNPTTIVVKYDDGTPVADATVMLRLAQSTGARTWNLTGVTDATGSLELMTDGNWLGAPAGEYQAAVTKEVPITEPSDEPGAAVVFIGPCISKKAECEQEESELEYAITFDELDDWLGEAKITIMPAAESEQRLSRFFPVSGGILKTMTQQSGVNYVAVDGPESCMAAVKDAMAGKLDGCFIEMSFCQGSCIGGPVFRNVNRSAAASYVKVAHDAAGETDFDIAPAPDMEAHFKNSRTYYMQPTEKQIAAVFKKMGKEGPEDELNCGMCGYASCRDKAIAVIMGRAEITMCMPYMKKRAESFSDKILSITPDAILAVDMDLRVQQINNAACEMFGVQPSDIVGQSVSALVDEFDFVDLISSGEAAKEKFTYLAEYNLYLKQSLYYDASSGIVICIMKNITREKQRQNMVMRHKTQVAGMADDIVDKQLRIVHEIASLLGESAAETKVAISKLKEAVMMENEEQ